MRPTSVFVRVHTCMYLRDLSAAGWLPLSACKQLPLWLPSRNSRLHLMSAVFCGWGVGGDVWWASEYSIGMGHVCSCVIAGVMIHRCNVFLLVCKAPGAYM